MLCAIYKRYAMAPSCITDLLCSFFLPQHTASKEVGENGRDGGEKQEEEPEEEVIVGPSGEP